MGAIASPPAYQRARAAVRDDDVARTLVHSLKYQDRTDLAPAMGRWMARAGQELLDEADVLVPVPLHWRRGWSRRSHSVQRAPATSKINLVLQGFLENNVWTRPMASSKIQHQFVGAAVGSNGAASQFTQSKVR